MALTIQSAIDLARIDLNDTDSAAYRNSDAELLKHANSALLSIYNRAPHLWHGNYEAIPNGEAVAGNPFPIEAQYLKPISDIIVAFAETKDDEHTDNGRVAGLIARAISLTTQ